MRSLRPWIQASLLLALVLALGACGRKPLQTVQTGQQVDKKLSTFAFMDENKLVTIIVDTRPTRYREAEPYIPLEICISNNGLRQLRLTRESFTLIDELGNRYPAAGPKELIKAYNMLDMDRGSLAELEGIVFNRFATYTRYPSQFSPTEFVGISGGNSIVRDSLVLPKFGYMLDFLYFPQPTTGLKEHYFELFVTSPDLPDPVFVKFEVR